MTNGRVRPARARAAEGSGSARDDEEPPRASSEAVAPADERVVVLVVDSKLLIGPV